MKKTIALTGGLILLTGCAVRANYENVLNSWVGATEMDLVRKWGYLNSFTRPAAENFWSIRRPGI